MSPTIDHRFCYGHRLLDYNGKCKHLHGHTARFEASLRDDTPDEWVAAHRLALRSWVDETLDAKMILRSDDPALDALDELGEPVYLVDTNPTTENLAKLIYDAAVQINIPVMSVRVWESPRCSASYSPDAVFGDNSSDQE